MSKLGDVLGDFRSFKNGPPKRGLVSNTLQTIKRNVVILVPVTTNVEYRWYFMLFMLKLVWSSSAPGSIVTGAMLSLLSLFAESPGAMLRTLLNDPDIDAQIVEVSKCEGDKIHIVTRGADMSKNEQNLREMANIGPGRNVEPWPFVKKDQSSLVTKTTEDLQMAIQTVTAQIWILLTKAVTAIDTARDSENRRWNKYSQQKRADKDYRLEEQWLNYARERIAQDISIRRYMVEILIECNKTSGVKSRVVQLICDIGNYISEAGLSGFFLTIKYGIETKYPALALNELQADLATVLQLMKLYMSLGEKAPYMVILEDAVQTKFSPGSYPLLWSYAMGVASMLDRAVNNLNFARSFEDRAFFELGESIVKQMEGSINNNIAKELELDESQIERVKAIVKLENQVTGSQARRVGQSTVASGSGMAIAPETMVPEPDSEEIPYVPLFQNPDPNAGSLFYKPNSVQTRNSPYGPLINDVHRITYKNKSADKEKELKNQLGSMLGFDDNDDQNRDEDITDQSAPDQSETGTDLDALN
uniref:Nucleocapsid n=1 Tax=Dendromus rat paramyxovirus TaxID=3141873 RepID=A0AAU7E363_9MONO